MKRGMDAATERVALVTGASSGIGRAVALELAGRGARVVVAGRSAERAEAVAREIRNAGGVAEVWLGDLREPAACAAMVERAVEAFGRLDVLVNNAGVSHAATAEETSEEQWRETLAVNLGAVFFASRAALPLMRRQGGGAIVNVASDWGLVGGERAAAYCASKGAVVLLTRAMALDHAREGIRINVVCPGDVDTPMLEEDFRQRGVDAARGRAESAASLPVGRVGLPEDVARLVAFLACDDPGFITGAAIPIDGGHTAG
jgi:NAD(P)-dependent dehydrogenase (short-subunit alcohol dehydrogenase family)